MGLGIYLAGDYPLATFGTPRRFLDGIRDWLSSHYGAMLIDARNGHREPDTEVLYVSIHPCAEDIEITADPEGFVTAGGKTTVTGAGYHIFLCELLRRMSSRFCIEWDEQDDDTGDETGF